MPQLAKKRLPAKKDAIAPDGSEVRVLLSLQGLGGTAHFKLKGGQISKAVTHKTVHEIWYVLKGRGKMWRAMDGQPDDVADLTPGLCVAVPLGTRFQFRASPSAPLEILGVTMPPWPNTPDEARVIEGTWRSNIP